MAIVEQSTWTMATFELIWPSVSESVKYELWLISCLKDMCLIGDNVITWIGNLSCVHATSLQMRADYFKFCFNDRSEFYKVVKALKMKFLSWYFACSILLGIPINDFKCLFAISVQEKKLEILARAFLSILKRSLLRLRKTQKIWALLFCLSASVPPSGEKLNF